MTDRAPTDSSDDADGEAFDAFLAALEEGSAPGVDEFIAGRVGTTPELKRRLERLVRRFGKGVERPTTIGGLRVERVLGRGGMGEVLEARDEALDRTVAVKILTPSFAGDPARIERFEREARILAALDHPNVATIFALGRSADAPPHIVMERIEGEDLARILARGALDWRTTLELCSQIAGALAAAHERRIVHRDLKPSTVMRRADGVAKVLDFGLAERIRTRRSDDAADSRSISGTPGYMSPEQARGGDATEASDVWSFGAIAFECVTGRRAKSPRTWPDDVPPGFAQLVESCLREDPSERPSSGSELVRRIRALREISISTDGELQALPPHRTRFIGRESERAAVRDAVEASPIVTLVGPGGAGKSRLAVEFARSRTSVAWVELSAAGDDDVVDAMLRAIGSRSKSAEDPLAELGDELKARGPLLLVVDNCEHVQAACARAMAASLDAAPFLRVLATSRVPLGLQGERVVRLEPLGVGTADEIVRWSSDELLARDAVSLFVDRGVAAGMAPLSADAPEDEAELRAVAELCRRVDGLPLAIELAAARAATIGVAELARRIDDHDSLLRSDTRDGLPHHQSLAALVDWSHDLLDPQERALFRRLSVFVDGWTLAAAEDVAASGSLADALRPDDVLLVLSRLTARSLVVNDARGGRWRFLETLKAYARARLDESDEADAVRVAHAERFIDLGERAIAESFGRERRATFLELEAELPDLLAAFRFALRSAELGPRAFAMVGGLFEFWISRGLLREGLAVLVEAQASGVDVSPTVRGFNDLSLGTVLHRLGRYDEARANLVRAREVGESCGDRSLIARARRNLGFLALHEKKFEETRQWFESALEIERSIDDKQRIGGLLNDLGVLAAYQCRWDDAVREYTESLAIRRDLDDDWGIASSLGNLGEANHRLGEFELARQQLGESLAGFRDQGDLRSVTESFEMSAALEVSMGDFDRATRLSGAAEGLRERFGFPIPEVEAGPYGADVAKMREALGDERYRELRSEGRALSLDAAMRLVFHEDQPSRE